MLATDPCEVCTHGSRVRIDAPQHLSLRLTVPLGFGKEGLHPFKNLWHDSLPLLLRPHLLRYVLKAAPDARCGGFLVLSRHLGHLVAHLLHQSCAGVDRLANYCGRCRAAGAASPSVLHRGWWPCRGTQ